ncbi:hypothetical protein ACIQNG_35465 [Streptomyces sp. NPDC091377]|uniref:hypothetical protein n=1 Tax=Streptomyces sp. NPDC091377 TaxID=3365995 RepID=UPI003803577F
MIRLPSSHAAITVPLVASSTRFPGIPIGRSLLDGRAFHLSPVLTDAAILPSTNSLALGGLGSGKSTTAKVRMHREIRDHGHQVVVIDSFGEDTTAGEWRPLVHALGGQVIQAGQFTLNPVSGLFAPAVREQLIRSLILAVEPGALSHQATHALQHALTHPKATCLSGLVDALVSPQDGRWPAAKLEQWGEGAAIALSRYTEGSLSGIFDGQDASLPDTDLPILSFDFTGLDRTSPAIPSLMAAVSCWAEHVWLPQSTAAHRHLVLEEAWQILLSPATAGMIQRLLKNSRKAALSLEAVMHTLSDLGDGLAQDLARLCEIVHVGRLGPEEAAAVGALLGLPQHAIDAIPTLGPGQAVWKVGPDYVDIIQTLLTDDEANLTDTSSRRRHAQQTLLTEEDPATGQESGALPAQDDGTDGYGPGEQARTEEEFARHPARDHGSEHSSGPTSPGRTGAPDADEQDWEWDMPHNVVDLRHAMALQAAREGRFGEAADIAAMGEREDIAAYGINSDQAASWLATRAQVADLCGNPDQAARLRATVARMGKDAEWFEQPGTSSTVPAEPHEPTSALPPQTPASPSSRTPRWPWRYIAAIAALAFVTASVWQYADIEQQREERKATADAYTGRSGAELRIDGVNADLVARWSSDRDQVVVELRSYFDPNARYLRLDASGKSDSRVRENGYYPKDPEIVLPVADPLADVTVRVAVGGKNWKDGTRVASQEIRLSPTGIAYDAQTGKKLPSDL